MVVPASYNEGSPTVVIDPEVGFVAPTQAGDQETPSQDAPQPTHHQGWGTRSLLTLATHRRILTRAHPLLPVVRNGGDAFVADQG